MLTTILCLWATELNSLTRQLQNEAEVTIQWFSDKAMELNPAKFQGLSLKADR